MGDVVDQFPRSQFLKGTDSDALDHRQSSWPASEPAIQEPGVPAFALVALDGRVRPGQDEECTKPPKSARMGQRLAVASAAAPHPALAIEGMGEGVRRAGCERWGNLIECME